MTALLLCGLQRITRGMYQPGAVRAFLASLAIRIFRQSKGNA